MSTRAIRHLNRKQIPFEVVRYDHQEKGAAYAAQATGFSLSRIVKTLVVDLSRGGYILALVPGDRELDLKALAKLCGVKRAAMADTHTVQRLTGYQMGGISPFGTQQRLKVLMAQDIENYVAVMINAGQRGVMLKMAPGDILRCLDATCAAIVR